MKNLHNKTVWVTGASSGIGEALVHQLKREGAKIVLSARRGGELARVAKEAGLTDSNSLILPMDLEQSEGYGALVDSVKQKFGGIEVLINNGGISQRSYFRDTKLEVFRKIFEVNFFGNVALTKAVLPVMEKQGGGNITVVSSVVGKFGTPLRTAYSASKHALHGFYDALRAEYADQNIAVLLVCPGYIKTNISINAVTGDGSPQGTMDAGQANGIAASDCAKQIIEGINSGKREIYPAGGKEKFGVYMKRFFPGVLAKMLKKVNVTAGWEKEDVV